MRQWEKLYSSHCCGGDGYKTPIKIILSVWNVLFSFEIQVPIGSCTRDIERKSLDSAYNSLTENPFFRLFMSFFSPKKLCVWLCVITLYSVPTLLFFVVTQRIRFDGFHSWNIHNFSVSTLSSSFWCVPNTNVVLLIVWFGLWAYIIGSIYHYSAHASLMHEETVAIVSMKSRISICTCSFYVAQYPSHWRFESAYTFFFRVSLPIHSG